jgi:hypothetical protein
MTVTAVLPAPVAGLALELAPFRRTGATSDIDGGQQLVAPAAT